MGIRLLNSFIHTHCSNAIQVQSFKQLKQKIGDQRIAIDASIYMYEFAKRGGNITDHFRNMIHLLHKYNICPVFIFDGVSPDDKQELLMERKQTKQQAQETRRVIEEQIQTGEIQKTEAINDTLQTLKIQSIKITHQQIRAVQSLLRKRQIIYITANGEADEVCAQISLIPEFRIWGCMSNDTDMFLYGCPNIIRNVCWDNEGTCEIYNTHQILDILNINMDTFIQIMVLAGTDYCKHISSINIFKIYRYWDKYVLFCKHKNKKKDIPEVQNHDPVLFYQWVFMYIKLEDEYTQTHTKIYDKIKKSHNDYNRHSYNICIA